MNAAIRSLALAAATLSAAPALAGEHRRAPPPPPIYAAPVSPALPPPYVVPVAPAPPVFSPVEWAPRWHGPMQELRAEYRRLEEARQDFYAGWRGHPGHQRRFERWYAWRRAELDRRYEYLAARRGHRDHDRRFAWNGEADWRRGHDRD